MTVEQLISLLKKCDPKAIVVLSSDSEGNTYSPAADYGIGFYICNEFYSAWKKAENRSVDLQGIEEAVECVALWPR